MKSRLYHSAVFCLGCATTTSAPPGNGWQTPSPCQSDSETCALKESFRVFVADRQYCHTDQDCALANVDCPFGVVIAVNTSEKDAVEAKYLEIVRTHNLVCFYSVVHWPESSECHQRLCTAVD